MLSAIVKKYPSVKTITEVENLMQEFDSSIKTTIKTSFVANPDEDKTYVKKLLTKMNAVSSRPSILNQTSIKQAEEQKEQQRNEVKPKEVSELNEEYNHQSILKPVSNLELEKDDKYENIVDKFLDSNDETEIKSAYARKIAPILNQRIEEKIEDYINSNQEGFDLSEAIRPKETLEEIMKAFDFYPDNDN